MSNESEHDENLMFFMTLEQIQAFSATANFEESGENAREFKLLETDHELEGEELTSASLQILQEQWVEENEKLETMKDSNVKVKEKGFHKKRKRKNTENKDLSDSSSTDFLLALKGRFSDQSTKKEELIEVFQSVQSSKPNSKNKKPKNLINKKVE